MLFVRYFKFKDYLISFFIITVTLLYFVAQDFVPLGIKSVTFLGFELENLGFPDINGLVYYFKMKFLILFFTIWWYLSCKHWWKSSILVIITIELLKLTSALNQNISKIDNIDYLVSLPITIPIILILVLVSVKINKYYLMKDLCSSIDVEIDRVFFELHNIESEEFELLKESFKKIKKEKNPKTYLKNLVLLRDGFYNKEINN